MGNAWVRPGDECAAVNFVTIRVFYIYPEDTTVREPFFKDYTVPENEPFVEAAAYKQWQRDLTIPHQMVAFSGTRVVKQEPGAPIVQLPLGFCETKYPGYFWDFNEQKLYSLKSGVLKELRLLMNNRFMKRMGPFTGYQVSHLGVNRYLRLEDLEKLVPTHCLIPKANVSKRQGTRWS